MGETYGGTSPYMSYGNDNCRGLFLGILLLAIMLYIFYKMYHILQNNRRKNYYNRMFGQYPRQRNRSYY